MWRTDAFQFLLAIALDLLLGDPHGWPHLTRGAGVLTTVFEALCVRALGRSVVAGVLLWACVCGTMLGVYFVVRNGLGLIHPSLAWCWDALVIYQTLAARDLARHAQDVHAPLLLGDLEESRRRVGYIVGRDTHNLEAAEISRAAVEAVAESATDGFVAPLFWAAVGGAPAALVYRAANTLDSMVGHRNEQYELVGKFSARADDVLNYIPARLCALASLIPRGFRYALAVSADAQRHASPNAGWSEAAAAWALRVRLGGVNFYDGLAQQGPVFNPLAPSPQPGDIPRVLRWFWGVSLGCVIVLLAGLVLRDNITPRAMPVLEEEPVAFTPTLNTEFTPQDSPRPVKTRAYITTPNPYATKPTP